MTGSQEGVRRSTVARWIVTAVALTLAGLALGQVAFSSATVSLTTHNPANTESAGTFAFTSTGDGQVIVSAAGLRPGLSQNGTVTVTGSGDFSGAYVLSRVSLVDTPVNPSVSTALTLKVENVTGPATTIYSGTLAAFSTASLGVIPSGGRSDYRLTLAYPLAAADPALQGASTSATLAFTAVAQ
jgi:hypothetical protein